MPIDTASATSGTTPVFQDPATAAAAKQAAKDKALKDEIATIKEKGFATYVKELEEEKIKKMREEILSRMGLSEEQLAAMPPEQRSTIEKMIAEEIQERLAVNSAVNDGKSDKDSVGEQAANNPLIGIASGGNMGAQMLQVLQEAETPETSADQNNQQKQRLFG
jgi:pyrroline-5-carboxylate reductase